MIALPDDDLLIRDRRPLAPGPPTAVRAVERTLTGAVAVHLVALPAAAAGVLPPLAAAVIAAGAPAVAAAPRGGDAPVRGPFRGPTAS